MRDAMAHSPPAKIGESTHQTTIQLRSASFLTCDRRGHKLAAGYLGRFERKKLAMRFS